MALGLHPTLIALLKLFDRSRLAGLHFANPSRNRLLPSRAGTPQTQEIKPNIPLLAREKAREVLFDLQNAHDVLRQGSSPESVKGAAHGALAKIRLALGALLKNMPHVHPRPP